MTIDPVEVALLVTGHLEALGIPHTIGGSLASSLAGEPRSTLDIDVVAALEEQHVDALVSRLSGAFYVDASSLRRAIQTRTITNLIHQATQLKVDLFVAGGTPLDARQIARRLAVDLGDGRTLQCIRRRTSCCRSSGGTGRAATSPSGSGGTSWQS